jgi:hypothetical protein
MSVHVGDSYIAEGELNVLDQFTTDTEQLKDVKEAYFMAIREIGRRKVK